MKHDRSAALPAALLPLLLVASASAAASPSRDACAGRFIDALPAVITSPGTWCLRRDLATAIASGSAIRIDVPNVTLDCNGHQLSGLAAGRASQAVGIEVVPAEFPGQQDAVIRGCRVRGFYSGIEAFTSSLVEDNRVEGSIVGGIYVTGDSGTLRRNLVVDTGGADVAHAAAIGVLGSVDMLDNTVDGVVAGSVDEGGSSQAIGMAVRRSFGATIRGNRIRGVDGVDAVYGIVVREEMNQRVLVADNQISLMGEGYGIHCPDDVTGLARDNVLHGAATPVWQCGDLGGNEVLP